MKSRLHKIEITNFKAFRDFTLNLEGRHLLVYGDNGSGKSSLYWALYTFLMQTPDPRLRLALFDYLVGTRAEDGPDLPKVLARYGFTPGTLEEAFLEHWRKPRG